MALTPVIVNGVTQYVQSGLVVDPLSGVAASVTAPGTSGVNASAMQGISGGFPLNVSVAPSGSAVANTSPVLVGLTSTDLISSVNTARVGFVIYNEGPSVIYLVYGPTAIVTPSGGGTYSTQLGPGDRPYVDTIPYYGIVSAVVGAGSSPSWVLVTELV
jgi:hypothetical protein